MSFNGERTFEKATAAIKGKVFIFEQHFNLNCFCFFKLAVVKECNYDMK